MISRRALKIIAIGYVIKTVVFGAAWLVIPDFPQRARETARQAWIWAGGAPAPVPPHAVPAAASGSVTAP